MFSAVGAGAYALGDQEWEGVGLMGDTDHHVPRIVFGEVEGDTYEAKIGVAAVVWNRAHSDLKYSGFTINPAETQNEYARVVSAKNQFDAYSDPTRWIKPDTAYNKLPPGRCTAFSDSVLAAYTVFLRNADFGPGGVGIPPDVLQFGAHGFVPVYNKDSFAQEVHAVIGKTTFYTLRAK